MNLKKLARVRNWNKARLLGFTIDKTCLNPSELEKFEEIERLKRELLFDWDSKSALIGLTVKRFVVKHPLYPEQGQKIITQKELKHYKEMGYEIQSKIIYS